MRPELEEELKALVAAGDAEIKLDDIEEVADWSSALRGRFYRPRKKAISLRLDMDVLEWLKAQPGPYTTRINELCRSEMLGQVLGAGTDPDAFIEALLKLPEGRHIILEALDQSSEAGAAVPRSYRFALYAGKELVFEGESTDPAARAELLAESGLEFDRLVISGRWSKGTSGSSQPEPGDGSRAKKTG